MELNPKADKNCKHCLGTGEKMTMSLFSLPALKHFRAVMKEVATSNGLIGNVEQSISYNDKDKNASVRQSVTSQKLLNNMKEHNEQREQNPNGDKNLESLPPRQL